MRSVEDHLDDNCIQDDMNETKITPSQHQRLLSVWRKYQSLKGAVGATLCQNEAEVKFPMEISNRCGGQCPLDILHLPHYGRGSRWVLLLICDRSNETITHVKKHGTIIRE